MHEAELLAELPRSLKGKVVLQLLKDVFNHSQMFMQLDHGARAMLSSALLPKPLLPGHDLCHPGDNANCLWILQKGKAPSFQTDSSICCAYSNNVALQIGGSGLDSKWLQPTRSSVHPMCC